MDFLYKPNDPITATNTSSLDSGWLITHLSQINHALQCTLGAHQGVVYSSFTVI